MKWSELYTKGKEPNFENVMEYIDSNYFNELCKFIEENYASIPTIEYSCCSLCPGWNIKYKKKNKAICTIYPNKNIFACMVTINNKIQEEIEYMLPRCDKYIQDVYKDMSFFNNNKWLMLNITTDKILEDIEELITIKMNNI